MTFSLQGYELTQSLYEGENSVIYRGNRLRDKKSVIIKFLIREHTPENLIQFKREFQLQSSLAGVGSVKTIGIEETAQTFAIIMEDDGLYPLKTFIHENGLSLEHFFKIALSLTQILENIHDHHIIHKDINPYNILCNSTYSEVKIIDFGISSMLLKEEIEIQNLKKLEGMLDYISPEQTGRMNRLIDYRTDFYSLGITFYEMLTSRLPFEETDTLELVHSHIAKIPISVIELNPNVPLILSEIIDKLIAKIPEDRYASCAGIREDLLKCQKQWLNNKTIVPFVLAQKDIRDELIFSQKIYGRENEIHQLLESFKNAYDGGNSCFFISGYSGIGKTSLVKEIYKPITQKNAYFISGKFDQLGKGKPYSAFIDAFTRLIRNILTESEESIYAIKKDLLAKIGNSGRVLTELLPEIEYILGTQPPIPDLNPIQSQQRLVWAFKNLLNTFGNKQHPLVIFLDDLQWIDSASLYLLENISTDKELRYLLFVGAYRDNEVNDYHPLSSTIKYIKKNNQSFVDLSLGPLKDKSVHLFLADSLNAHATDITPLADIVLTKTQGNPFFINEFLRKLHHEKLLYFSYHKYSWQWDLEKIQLQSLTDNVVDLLTNRIHRLPTEAQEILQYAACIGHEFSIETLLIISEKRLPDLINAITLGIQHSFILPLDKNHQYLEFNTENSIVLNKSISYRFQHDRVQQAAYQLIETSKKQFIHLHIAGLLIKNKNLTENDENLFDIVNHFNHGLALISHEEKPQIATYNLWAGRKAKASSAFNVAKQYLNTGIDLVNPLDNKELYFELSKELAICLYLDKEFEQAEHIFKKLTKDTDNIYSKVEIYKLHSQMLSAQAKHVAALEVGVQALKALGFQVSLHPTSWDLLKIKLKIAYILWRRPIGSFEFKLMTHENAKIAMDIIAQWGISALMSDPNFYKYILSMMLYLSLKYGYTKDSTAAGYALAVQVLHRWDNHPKAMRIIDFYTKTENKYGLASSKAKLYTILASLINPWRMPLDECYDQAEKAYQYCIEESNFFYALIAKISIISYSNMTGKSLPDMKKKSLEGTEFLRRHKQTNYEFAATTCINRCLAYEGCDNPLTYLRKNKEIFFSGSDRFTHFAGVVYLVQDFYMFKDYDEAYDCVNIVNIHDKDRKLGTVDDVLMEFYTGLTLLANPKKINRNNKKLLKKIHKTLKTNNALYTENFAFYLRLFEAEYENFKQNILLSSQHYHEAIRLAEKNKNLFAIGLASERAGIFYEKIKLPDIANTFFSNAHTMYKKWGSPALCKFIEDSHPNLFSPQHVKGIVKSKRTTTIDSHAASIDVLSLLKATQAISSEIQLDILLQKLILVLLKNAGAQRGVIMVKEDTKDSDNWYVVVEGTTAVQHVSLKNEVEIKTRTDLPLSMIRYVQRTQQQVLAQSSLEFENYKDDNYINEIKPQSIIIIPLSYQGKFKTILFLENRTTSHAFTPEHIHTLTVLSSQAVISLENARLYYQATHDPLTGLANRNLLYQIFPIFIGNAVRTGKHIAVLFLDLDGFKKINDRLGHEVGDLLLIQFAERLKRCIREGDLAVRLGGDEFVAILQDADYAQITAIAERILNVTEPFQIQGHAIPVKTSIGISVFPEHSDDIQTLLKQADIALYRVKKAGKGFYQFYTQSLDDNAEQETLLAPELAMALKRNELFIYYQPIYKAHTGELTHFEALLRWEHPSLGLLESNAFIHLAEANDLIQSIGHWVFTTVFQQLKTWKLANIKPVPIAINISAAQLSHESISSLITTYLNDYQIEPGLIELELTESLFIELNPQISKDIHNLKNLGIKLTLDDFGTHYSSLSYLRRFPIDQIKIDQSFIRDIENQASDRELITSMITLAHNLHLCVIAEGIETIYQIEFLKKHGIDELQGYYLNRPMTVEDATNLLEERHFISHI